MYGDVMHFSFQICISILLVLYSGIELSKLHMNMAENKPCEKMYPNCIIAFLFN